MPRRHAWFLIVGLATACGAHRQEPPRGGAAPAPTVSVSSPAATSPRFLALEQELGRPELTRRWRSLTESARFCQPESMESEYDCSIESTVAFDAERGSWLVIDTNHSEGEMEDFRILEVSLHSTRSLLPEEVDRLVALRRIVARRRLPVPASGIALEGTRQHSLNTYAELVALAAPYEGWLLWLETPADLDDPRHVLHLVARDHSAAFELGRRTGLTGPCDGDGYGCGEPERECDDAGLRAEGRLCVEPLGINGVAFGPDGTLIVQGTRQVAGHGGYPGFHWLVAMPDEVRPVEAEAAAVN